MKGMLQQYSFLTKLFNYKSLDIQIIAVWSALVSIFISFSNDFLGISAGIFAMLFIVMITDYVTGLAASRYEEVQKAKKENRCPKDVFTSKKGLRWVFKFGSYIVFLYISCMLQEHITVNKLDVLTYFSKIAHFYILIHIFSWELKSVDENFARLGFKFQIFGLFRGVFSTLKQVIEPSIGKTTKSKDE